jgi:hypothetical protein
VVEGISELGEGVLLGERYRLAHRIELLTDGTERVAGVEYEYWAAQDVADGADVWIQFAAADGVYAEGAALAGAVAALRRINHPAVPAVRAFGEYEFELEGEIASVGYCAVPAYAGETLAAALLREELDQAEILAALGQVGEVLELLAEFELVHGHLSAHSVLLSASVDEGYGVVLLDLAASLSLETALESELTAAADVYALAWLIVLALVGPAALEAEFGAGFAVTTELDLLAEQVVLRRRIWAEENLVALGFSAGFAAVLLLALGEAGGRPRASILTAALRAEWMLYAEGVGVVGVGVRDEAEAGAAALAAAAVVAGAVAEEVAVEELAAEEIVSEQIASEEIAVEQASGRAAAEEVAAGVGEAALLAEAVGVLGGVGTAQANSAAAATSSAAAVTEMIPRTPAATGASGAARTPRAARSAGSARAAGSAQASGSVGVSGAGGSRGGTGPGRSRKRPRPGVLIGTGVGVVIVIALIIVFATGGSKGTTSASGALTASAASSSSSASAGSAGSPAASASASSAASPATSPTVGSGGGASASSTTGGGASASSAGTSGSVVFPTALGTVPASAGQTVQLIQSAASQAQGELSGGEQGQLSQIIGTLNQEVGSGQSLSTGTAQLWTLLHSGELPSSLNNYLTLLASYLSASQGS